MYKKIINRYVENVLEYLPLRDRRKARNVITGLIYDQLEEYMEGERPAGRDARAVLRELGTPEYLAHAYYKQFHKSLISKVNPGKALGRLVQLATVLALVLVAVGVIELVLGFGNMTFIVAGTILGIAVVLYQMIVLPNGKEQNIWKIEE